MTPVNVFAKVPKESFFISSAALLDILLIAMMLMLTASKFVLAPGMSMELGGKNSLPETSAPDYAGVDSDLSVLTAEGNSMLIFDGSIFNMGTLAKKMKTFKGGGDVLLIKADKNMSIDSLVKIAEIAKTGGFKKIHIAAKPRK